MVASLEVGRHLDADEQRALAATYLGVGELVQQPSEGGRKAPAEVLLRAQRLDVADVAQRLGWTAGRVQETITRARKKVRRALQRADC